MSITERVFGHFVIFDNESNEETHRIPVPYPEDSSSWEKVEAGLFRRVDLDRFYFRWEEADG